MSGGVFSRAYAEVIRSRLFESTSRCQVREYMPAASIGMSLCQVSPFDESRHAGHVIADTRAYDNELQYN